LCWLIVPLFFALVYYLQTKNKVFDLTTQRLKITSGVFTKVTVPSSVGFADKLRLQVEIIRQQKRVREIDIE
jgi:hypothetical protein